MPRLWGPIYQSKVNSSSTFLSNINSFNPNLCDHLSSIPSLIPTSFTSTWTWVLSLDVFESFHLNFHHLQLYNHIPTTLQCDLQMAFFFPLDKLTHDPNDVAIWPLFLLLSQWCFVLPFHGRATWHKETWVQLECFQTSDWENLQDEFFFNPSFGDKSKLSAFSLT